MSDDTFNDNEFPTTPDGGITLQGRSEDYIRSFAEILIKAFVPSVAGDPRFDEIAKDFGGKGTTCGYFVHWLRWRLGARDKHQVNRNEPDDGLVYIDGHNLMLIFNSGRSPFKAYRQDSPPKKGDTIFIADGLNPPAHNPETEHVFILMGIEQRADGEYWLQAQAGGTDPATGKQCAHFTEGKRVGNKLCYSWGTRVIIGSRDLLDIPLTAPATTYVADSSPVA